jgi:hypothetical protein
LGAKVAHIVHLQLTLAFSPVRWFTHGLPLNPGRWWQCRANLILITMLGRCAGTWRCSIGGQPTSQKPIGKYVRQVIYTVVQMQVAPQQVQYGSLQNYPGAFAQKPAQQLAPVPAPSQGAYSFAPLMTPGASMAGFGGVPPHPRAAVSQQVQAQGQAPGVPANMNGHRGSVAQALNAPRNVFNLGGHAALQVDQQAYMYPNPASVGIGQGHGYATSATTAVYMQHMVQARALAATRAAAVWPEQSTFLGGLRQGDEARSGLPGQSQATQFLSQQYRQGVAPNQPGWDFRGQQ